MGEPLKKLSSELLRDHPALVAFSEFVQERQWTPPNAADIQVDYDKPQDGVVIVNYESPDGIFYAGQLDANVGLLKLTSGPIVKRQNGLPREVRFEKPKEQSFEDLCRTVKALGGKQESQATCRDSDKLEGLKTPELKKANQLLWTTAVLGANWSFAEVCGFWGRRRLGVSLPGPIRASFWASALAYELAYFHLGDWVKMTENDHSLERRALGISAASVSYYLMSHIPFWASPSAKKFLASPVRFGSSLLAAGLAETIFGDAFGKSSRDLHGGHFAASTLGFFLPQFYQIAQWHRGARLAGRSSSVGSWIRIGKYGLQHEGPLLTNMRHFRQESLRWAGHVMAVGFVADTVYMGANYLIQGSEASARENQVYERATALQDHDFGLTASFGHGLANLVAPFLTRRFLVSDRYVSQAREEFRAQAEQISEGAQPLLRHALLFGSAGESLDPRFYTEANGNALRGDNALRDVTLPGGRVLPVESVAEQLSDPDIYRRVVEGSDLESQISYVQREFRAYRLSHSEAADILTRIALHRARTSLGAISAAPHSLAGMFDETGALRNGSETELLKQVFPEERADSRQLLAMRRTALAARIMKLRDENPSGSRDLAAYTDVARQVGVLDSQGNFTDSSVRES